MTASDADRDGSGELAPLGRTLAVARPASRRVVFATLLGAGAIAADIGLLGTAAWLISKAAQHPNEATLAVAIVAVQFFGLSRGFLRYEERLVGHDAAFRLLADLRVRVYQRLERLAPSGLPSFRRGDLLARMVQDVDSLQDLVLRVVPPFGIALVVGVSTVVLLWWMLPAAALILAVSLVLAATVVPWLTGLLARRREARFAAVRGDLGAAMVDLTEGAAELIAFGAADAHIRTIREPGCGTDRHRLGLGRDRRHRAGPDDAPGRAGLLGLPHGRHPRRPVGSARGHGVGRHHAHPPGRLRARRRSPGGHPGPAAGASGRGAGLRGPRRSGAHASIPRWPPRSPGRPTTWRCGRRGRAIPDAASPALGDVDLSLPPGRRVAVVGPSGAGKSTLAAILVGFLPCRAGSITLSGVPTEQFSGDDLRTVVGLVGQDAYLFDTTVAENLRVGRRDATDDQLHDVLDRVGLAAWLDDLPEGLATEVGSHGARLSGGQRQRLAVARALLADFPVLVLDEPAEHLEPAAADALTADLLDVTDGRVARPHHPPSGRARVRRRDPGHGARPGGRNGAPTTNCSARPGATPTSGGRR